jgi:hypothetical protein
MDRIGSIRPPVDRRLFELLKANTPVPEIRDTVELGAFRLMDSKPGAAILREQVQPGTLYVVDQFKLPPSLPVPGLFSAVEHHASKDSHGAIVASTAREAGFAGPLLSIEGTRELDIDDPDFDWGHTWRESEDPAQLSKALLDSAISQQTGPLKDHTKIMHEMLQGGVSNGAVNFSSGGSPAGTVNYFLDRILRDPDASEEKKAEEKAERKRFSLAMGLSGEKLSSEDPRVADPEWARLIQKLVDVAVQAQESPAFQEAKQNYDQACEMLTASNNSVVVSAGNEQEIPELLTELTGGKQPDLPADFLINHLTNDHTVAVGALAGRQIAEYSCRYPSVRFYVDGERNGETGTSLSAPRLAAVLAKLHKRQPEWDTRQAQNYVSEHLCVTMDGVKALDTRAAKRFLRS